MPSNGELDKPGRPGLPKNEVSPDVQELTSELIEKYFHADIEGLKKDLSNRFRNHPSKVRDEKIFQVIHELGGHCAQVCTQISLLKP